MASYNSPINVPFNMVQPCDLEKSALIANITYLIKNVSKVDYEKVDRKEVIKYIKYLFDRAEELSIFTDATKETNEMFWKLTTLYLPSSSIVKSTNTKSLKTTTAKVICVLDCSGSMANTYFATLKTQLASMMKKYNEQGCKALSITFSSYASSSYDPAFFNSAYPSGSTAANKAIEEIGKNIDESENAVVIFITDGGFDSPDLTYNMKNIIGKNISAFLMAFPQWCPPNVADLHKHRLVGILPPTTSIRAEYASDFSVLETMVNDCVGSVTSLVKSDNTYVVLGGKYKVMRKFVETIRDCVNLLESLIDSTKYGDNDLTEFQSFFQNLLEIYTQIVESAKVNLLNTLRSNEIKTLWTLIPVIQTKLEECSENPKISAISEIMLEKMRELQSTVASLKDKFVNAKSNASPEDKEIVKKAFASIKMRSEKDDIHDYIKKKGGVRFYVKFNSTIDEETLIEFGRYPHVPYHISDKVFRWITDFHFTKDPSGIPFAMNQSFATLNMFRLAPTSVSNMTFQTMLATKMIVHCLAEIIRLQKNGFKSRINKMVFTSMVKKVMTLHPDIVKTMTDFNEPDYLSLSWLDDIIQIAPLLQLETSGDVPEFWKAIDDKTIKLDVDKVNNLRNKMIVSIVYKNIPTSFSETIEYPVYKDGGNVNKKELVAVIDGYGIPVDWIAYSGMTTNIEHIIGTNPNAVYRNRLISIFKKYDEHSSAPHIILSNFWSEYKASHHTELDERQLKSKFPIAYSTEEANKISSSIGHVGSVEYKKNTFTVDSKKIVKSCEIVDDEIRSELYKLVCNKNQLSMADCLTQLKSDIEPCLLKKINSEHELLKIRLGEEHTKISNLFAKLSNPPITEYFKYVHIEGEKENQICIHGFDEIPDEIILEEDLICPITMGVIVNPVKFGLHYFEKDALIEWLDECTSQGKPLISPMTGLEPDDITLYDAPEFVEKIKTFHEKLKYY